MPDPAADPSAEGPMEEIPVTSIISSAGRRSAAAGIVVAAAFCFAPGGAQAQLNPQELLKQVLPGAAQGTSDNDAAAGEFECQRYAEDQGLEVRRIVESRRSGTNNLEVTLSVDDRDERYDARCIYDSGDREVRELEPVRIASRSSRSDEDVDDGMARRARQACAEMAEDRDLDALDLEDPRPRGAEVVEIEMRVMVDGDRRDLTCLYEDDQRRALLAE
jgi:hypothetical protein